MTPSTLKSGLLTAVIVAASSADATAQSQDIAEIRQVQVRQAEAWNSHDAAAYAALFSQDGEVVNVVGWWWKGRPEIESKLAAAFAYVFHESVLTITDVQTRFLDPGLAIAHVRWTMTGARTPPGVPEPRAGIELQVLRKQAGQWLIVSFQNTHSVPEVPFPTGPPSSTPGRP